MAGRTGYPAIIKPLSLQRDAQTAIDAIRQRIETLEADLRTATATSQASISVLQTQVTTIGGSAPGGGTQPATTTYTAAQAISAGQALFLVGPTSVAVSDPTVLASAFGCFAVATANAGPGGTVSLATAGQVATVFGAAFTPFLPVYCGAAGVLTQSPSASSAVIQVGVAISATQVLVAPAPTLLNAISLTPALDDFLPIVRNPGVTWQINGLTIGVRREVNFLPAGGIPIYGYDDPGSNRVVIVIGTTGLTLPGNQIEDAWDWAYEELPDEAWFVGYDDTVQGNNSVLFPRFAEDGWPWEEIDPEDPPWPE